MMKQILWLGESGIPRRGPALKHGQTYPAAAFPAAVVDEWVKTGAAQIIEDKEAPKKINGGK